MGEDFQTNYTKNTLQIEELVRPISVPPNHVLPRSKLKKKTKKFYHYID